MAATWRGGRSRAGVAARREKHDRLAANPDKRLAGGAVKVIATGDGKVKNNCPFPGQPSPDPAARVLEFFARKDGFHACDWFYGLWRTDYLREITALVWSRYGSETLWGTDALTVLRPVIENAFVGDGDTTYRKRLIMDQRSHVVVSRREKRLLYLECLKVYRDIVAAATLTAEDRRKLIPRAVPFSRRTANQNFFKDCCWFLRDAWAMVTGKARR